MSEATVQLGTKGESLARLQGRLQGARILDLWILGWNDWRHSRENSLGGVIHWWKSLGSIPLMVRSSSCLEDRPRTSLAGRYFSVPNVQTEKELASAIDQVFAAYEGVSSADQVLIQPFLEDVKISGVTFTLDPNTGAPYFVINYDDRGPSTGRVTSGCTDDTKTLYVHDSAEERCPSPWRGMIELSRELQQLVGLAALDIEWAYTTKGEWVLFQVRPLEIHGLTGIDQPHSEVMRTIHSNFVRLSEKSPRLLGRRALFGVMTDWNPAEMIGIRPRPLALSLYRNLLTDQVWAEQRANYGYRDVRGVPLLHSVGGMPYIDIRTDFNSFVPAALRDSVAEKIVDHWLEQLARAPHLHDKVEFELLDTCYTFDLGARLEENSRLTAVERDEIFSSLRSLTNAIVHPKFERLARELSQVERLAQRQLASAATLGETLHEIRTLGTLPFAGAARCAFIAVRMLRSLSEIGALTDEETASFLGSIETVSTQLSRDFGDMPRAEFLKRYGHLRPGTYEMTSLRYDEAPEVYFQKWERKSPVARQPHSWSDSTLTRIDRHLKEAELTFTARDLILFTEGAIRARERAKFVFTRSVSDLLVHLLKCGQAHGLSRDECSFLNLDTWDRLTTGQNLHLGIQAILIEAKKDFRINETLTLPPLIQSADDVYLHWIPECEPNFVTRGSVTGRPVWIRLGQARPEMDLRGAILMIENADPGYDWIFSRGIAGLITLYGGPNSHMAVRALELSIPSVIGAGKVRFEKWSGARLLEMDCLNKQVRMIG